MSILAQPTAGENYRIHLVDVDGNALSTADGRITTLVLVNQSNIDKARAVGDRIPDSCLGNSSYRMITVLAFEKKHSKPVRMIMASLNAATARFRSTPPPIALRSTEDCAKCSPGCLRGCGFRWNHQRPTGRVARCRSFPRFCFRAKRRIIEAMGRCPELPGVGYSVEVAFCHSERSRGISYYF
jgi:hypothetical protein